ncbi:MAG TPA: hypothetical protein VFA07_09925 [Chthonomonadaceae bacterium]|nr:hypothetical protein [Chthonomonadaceae bacterium]
MVRRARKQDAHISRPCRENDHIEEIIAAVEQEEALTEEERRYLRELLQRAGVEKSDGAHIPRSKDP